MLKNSHEKGILGEQIAVKYLVKKGYTLIEMNYRKKWGEIDIITKKSGVLNFFEVKSVLLNNLKDDKEDKSESRFRPEENVHVLKLRKLRRTVQTYLLERKHGLNAEFLFHVLIVKINTVTRKARVSMIENVIL